MRNYLNEFTELYNDGYTRNELIDLALEQSKGNAAEYYLMIDAINFIYSSEGL